jgi:hypothetical protein
MKDQFFVLSKGILGLRTNGKNLKWSFGINTPPATEEDYQACALRLRLNVGEVPGFSKEGVLTGEKTLGKYHYFSGTPGADVLYYHRPFLLKKQLQIQVKDVLADEPCVTVNDSYFRYITHRFMNLHSIGYILTDLAVLLLLRRGFAALHCSAFKKGENTVVVFAPPNTGKTLSTMMACMEYGAEFLAEDLAITDGRRVYSVPWTSTFRYYSRVEQSRFSRFLNAATRVFPPLELLPLSKAKPIHNYVQSDKLADSAKITHLIILERGSTEVCEEASDEAYRKIVNLNRFEFNYHRAPLVVAYEFFNPSLDIDSAWNAERDILRRMIVDARHRLVVRTDDATQYTPLIMEALQESDPISHDTAPVGEDGDRAIA